MVAKCEGALPDTYGKGAEELAVLLNSYLQKAKARSGEQSIKPECGRQQ